MKIYKTSDEINSFFKYLEQRNKSNVFEVTQIVDEIIENVRCEGDKALARYALKFDKVDYSICNMEVTELEIEEAFKEINPNLVNVIKRASNNIKIFHEKQLDKSWFTSEEEGVFLGQKITPINRVGVYVPGGTAPLPSSVLMNIIPAKVAGVEEVIMCTPPGKDGKVNSAILVAAKLSGANRIFKVGGAQAIAAMAFGTESIPSVDKVTGPGNIFVATAKKRVYGFCDIDMIAGPSEVMIVADDTANPAFVAADLLSQAEHDKLASAILVALNEEFARLVIIELEKQLKLLTRQEITKESLENYGAILIVEDINKAIDLVNIVAPEHLELCIDNPISILNSIKNAGAIFMGNYSPEPLGDYYAGPNHVLPTSGTARFFSPLNVTDFIKRSSIISYNENALRRVKEDVILFAKEEGLDAHANSISIRFKEE